MYQISMYQVPEVDSSYKQDSKNINRHHSFTAHPGHEQLFHNKYLFYRNNMINFSNYIISNLVFLQYNIMFILLLQRKPFKWVVEKTSSPVTQTQEIFDLIPVL